MPIDLLPLIVGKTVYASLQWIAGHPVLASHCVLLTFCIGMPADAGDAVQAAVEQNVEIREHFPAASASQDTYTLLKFYNLSVDLVKAVLMVSAS